MNMAFIDWVIVFGVVALLAVVILGTKKYVRSVADYVAGGRCAGRYLISVSGEMAGFGAVAIIIQFQIFYEAGFTAQWWQFATLFMQAVVAMSGWAFYRFRETRAMTLAQFYEMRYSRNFRIFAGATGWISGIVNFGVFPGIGARFFIHFCGLPDYVNIWGYNASVFVLLMLIILSVTLFFTFLGGQIGVMVTDFAQGIFMSLVFIAIVAVALNSVSWMDISDTMINSPSNMSVVNPFQTSGIKTYNVWFYLISIVSMLYCNLSWQGAQGYRSAAKSAHELKMSNVLYQWRRRTTVIFPMILALCAYTIYNNSNYASMADGANALLGNITDEQVASQLRTPAAMLQILPAGFVGGFVAIMCCALISTYDSYMHSWGSIFVQDIVVPLRKKPLPHEKQILFIRLSTTFVAVFSFVFSLFFNLTEDIWPFLAVSGAIYIGGAGSAIVGGLYWKKGTTLAAWVAMIVGAVTAVAGIVIKQKYPDFIFNGQHMFFFSMLISVISYVVISLLTCKKDFNLEKMLHRGKYAIAGEHSADTNSMISKNRFLVMLGVTKECTKSDKFLIYSTFGWSFGWLAVFVLATIFHFTIGISNQGWMVICNFYIWLTVLVAIVTTIIFLVGGTKDINYLVKFLKTAKRDHTDDGSVSDKEQD